MLGVIDDIEVDAQGLQRIGVGGDGAVAGAGDLGFLAVVGHGGGDGGIGIFGGNIVDLKRFQLQRGGAVQEFGGEDIPHILGIDLAAFGIGDFLHDGGKLRLHGARHIDAVVGLHDVGDATLAGLGVDADNGLVIAAHVLRVDGQVGNLPDGIAQLFPADVGGIGLRTHRCGQRVQALIDGILVRAGERGKDQFTAVGVALRDTQLVTVLHGFADLGQIGEIDLGVNALSEHVQAQGHQVHVAGALAIAKQAALNAVGAGHIAQLGGGNALAAVIVGVQRNQDGIAPGQVAVHPLDGIGVDIRRNHLHRGRQIDDHRVLGARIHDGDHVIADLAGEIQLGAGKGLRGVLPAPVGIGVVGGDGFDELGGIGSQLLDGRLVLAEDHAALQLRGGVIKVHDDVLGAGAGLEGAADQVFAGLDEDLDGHVLWNLIALDDFADEVEVRLGGGREADLDFLVAHLHQQVEHAVLALGAHGIDQCLVAIAQVHGAPLRGVGDLLARPSAVRQVDVLDLYGEGLVALEGHGGAALLIPGGLSLAGRACRGGDFAGCADEGIVGRHGGAVSLMCLVSGSVTASWAKDCQTPRRGAGRRFRPKSRRGR